MRDLFLEGMSKTACSVYVVTTDGIAGRRGVTVSAVSSVSADTPNPTLLTCVHHLSPTAAAIRQNRSFCVNLLGDDQTTVSDSFAGRTDAKDEAKFDCATWTKGETGAPMLQGALASFDCTVQHEITCGSHHIFVGEVRHVGLNEGDKALVYANRGYNNAQPLDAR
ncbi:flavin reductase family protein [Parasedimentitalea maritima]|uniref:Flavin reductase n=1 Tax=Parasedimentitalea maritima TaxID=2578117 RepID=A0A6A4REX8_9RHOB|nr:flavin reductase family protein [Zongyanglinia marina]KAE9627218.1 flavin reductase [Zongyanglinia marina]